MGRRRKHLVTGLLALVAAMASSATADARQIAFKSPSSNISCFLTSGNEGNQVQCWVLSAKCWNPEVGDFLAFAWLVSARGRVSKFCPGDFVPTDRTLKYGRRIQRGVIRCTSRKSGMRCVSLRSHHGFVLSRARQKRF